MVPYWPRNMFFQVTTAMYCGMAQGIINRVRKTFLPDNFLFKSRARKSPPAIWKNTLTPVQTKVRIVVV
jgi:hypothetical protein